MAFALARAALLSGPFRACRATRITHRALQRRLTILYRPFRPRPAFIPSTFSFSSSTPHTLDMPRSTLDSSVDAPSVASAPPHAAQYREVAIRAVAAANSLARSVQESVTTNTLIKSDSSPVTVADFGVQTYIVSMLHAAFPHHKFIAEESSADLVANPKLLNDVLASVNMTAKKFGSPLLTAAQVISTIDLCSYQGGDNDQLTWILDPIDGTKGYVGMRQYCVALALVSGGKPVLGFLGCPNLPIDGINPTGIPSKDLGVIFHATTGCGTYMLSESNYAHAATSVTLGVRVRTSDEPDTTRACIAESVEKAHSSHSVSGQIAHILGVQTPSMRMDSQAKYGCLSRGDAHVFLRFPKSGYVENVWDHAAGAIVIEEAGGKVTDGRGRDLDFSKGRFLDNDDGIVATNGNMHMAVIEAVQKTLAQK